MPSLKEVKTRIASVNSTRKITSAMKMVASSKLRRAQQAIEQMRPYEERLNNIMATFLKNMQGEVASPYAVTREVKRVVLVAYTSNSSLCGGFNLNVIKELKKAVEAYREAGVEVVKVYPIGRKAFDAMRKDGFSGLTDYSAVLNHPAYAPVVKVASEIMEMYVRGEIDKAEIFYHHFKSSSAQVLRREDFLPVSLDVQECDEDEALALDYIVEPSPAEILTELIPKALHLKLYAAMLDSLASEHAARVIAMQVATDNADELLRELTLQYNKSRQQAITNELLDLAGGAMQ